MSYYILGVSRKEFKQKITRQTAACAAVLAGAAALNILLCCLRTEATHLAFLVANIVIDSAAIGFVYFLVSTQLLPRRKLDSLACRERWGTVMTGTIRDVSKSSKMVCGLECVEAVVEEPAVRKVFITRENGVPFELSGKAALTLVDNIVVRAGECDE